jgi:hypothetical protein
VLSRPILAISTLGYNEGQSEALHRQQKLEHTRPRNEALDLDLSQGSLGNIHRTAFPKIEKGGDE